MMALILYAVLGRDAAVAEVAAELLIGLVIMRGGGGKRVRRGLELLLEGRQQLQRRRPALVG